jgi:LEA14-like dessication related protein
MKRWIWRWSAWQFFSPPKQSGDHAMMRRLALKASALGPWIALSAGCATVLPPANLKAPEIALNDFSVGRFDLKEMLFDLKLNLKNPNAVALPLSNLRLELALLGVPVAFGQGPSGSFTIPANGSSIVPMQLSVPFGKITESMRSLRQNPSAEQPYQLKGSVAWGPLGLALNFERKGNIRDLLSKFLPQAR